MLNDRFSEHSKKEMLHGLSGLQIQNGAKSSHQCGLFMHMRKKKVNSQMNDISTVR